jgi:hypothetical protein
MNPPSGSRMRTGLSDALATDEADDSYDLRWLRDLPLDELRAITMLHQMLECEADAIDRHFMHAHLQALLYRFRDVFASALGEYDQACQQHDAEMGMTRRFGPAVLTSAGPTRPRWVSAVAAPLTTRTPNRSGHARPVNVPGALHQRVRLWVLLRRSSNS